MTLSKGARDAIAGAVQRLRTQFEEEFTQQATGRFGLHTDRRAVPVPFYEMRSRDDPEANIRPWVEPLQALSLTPTQVIQRSELVGAIAYLLREGLDAGEAVARLIREAAFTATNQLLAVRVAEAIKVLPEVTAQGRQSLGYREIVRDLFPLLAREDDEGLWIYIQVCGDELGATVPLLFDRRLPTAAFVPSRTCVDNAIAIINEPDVAPAWQEPEALGWAYQFFNREDERKEMRKSAAPRNTRELAVRNQFFTPRYVVDWLVQNTLGRRLREAGYDVDLPMLVGEPGARTPLALEDVRVIDPAVGSGHFLLGCYDILEQAWRAKGVSPVEAAPRILRSLHGIDIDPRASQVAQAVLVLRARRAAPHTDLQPPAIATAHPLPASPDARREVFQRLPQNARDLAGDLNNALELASTLGSLLKVEESFDSAVQQALDTPKLDEKEVTAEALERELIDAIEEITRRADASPISRLFAADARDALRFVRLSQLRYDVVLMNPPFGDPVPDTKAYLSRSYGDSATDLYAAFVNRGVNLLNEHGYLGAITSRSGFFLATFEDWRSQLVLPRMVTLVDLGVGVMHDAMVEAAVYVLAAQPHHDRASFRRLLDEHDKASAVYEATDEPFLRQRDDFAQIPGSPAAYWLSPQLRDLFRKYQMLKATPGVDVRQGLATADDFRFVRLWWEVPPTEIGRRLRWVPFAKGGDYSPYYADLHLVVDWQDDGYRIRGFDRSYIRNDSFYFRPGLTWSRRTQKGFSVRPVQAGAIFGDKGPMIFVPSDDPEHLDRLMAYLNSGLAGALLEGMVAFGSYEVGAVGRLPAIAADDEAVLLADQLTRIRMSEGEKLETGHIFVSPWARGVGDADSALTMSRQIDEAVSRAVGEDGTTKPLSATYPSRWFHEDYKSSGSPTVHQELSYLLGIALGRWDVRIPLGAAEPPLLPGPYDPLPPVSRGTLVGEDGLPTRRPPNGYPLDLPSDRMLHDELGHPRDVVAAIEDVLRLLETASDLPELNLSREVRDLRRHLRDRFFAGHFKDYSASRRYAPIYWYLAVRSRKWGLWVYAPGLSREMLFAIVGAAREKLRRLREQADQLRHRPADSADRDAIERMEQVESLASEVEQFAEYADKVAQSGWQPDLNDGLVLCAAPLEPLFADDVWRKYVVRHRMSLEQKRYPWATVQRAFFGADSDSTS